MTFEEMNLIGPLLGAVRHSGYETPTPIQQATIPLALEGKDVLGCAQTGTGKTAAFALPILQRLAKNNPPIGPRPIRALILTPTRELAQQIYDSFLEYGSRRLSLTPTVVFGGVSQHPQTAQLQRGVDILVATPGRLNDLIQQGYIHLDKVEIFVLDEADRMLDMGFIRDMERVIARLPVKRQTLFFSATMPREVENLALMILKNPETVKVDSVTTPVDSVRQVLYYVDRANKKNLLAHLLGQPEIENALIFARTRHGADRVVKELDSAGIRALAIHGSKSQNARQDALNQFKSGRLNALVATDIAARGIDIAGLSHVINYDLPHEPEVYIHRIGRTGRAGLSGDAISFCSIDEVKDLGQIEALIGKRIPTLESAWPMEVFTPSPPKAANTHAPARLTMKGEPARARTPRYSEPARGAGGYSSNRPAGQDRFGGGRAGDQPTRPAGQDRFGGGRPGDQPARSAGQDRFGGGRPGDQPARPAGQDRFGGGRPGGEPARPAGQDRFGGGRAGGRPFDGARRSGGRPGDRKR